MLFVVVSYLGALIRASPLRAHVLSFSVWPEQSPTSCAMNERGGALFGWAATPCAMKESIHCLAGWPEHDDKKEGLRYEVQRCSTSPLQNMATAVARRSLLIRCRFFVSINPARLKDRSTTAADVGYHK